MPSNTPPAAIASAVTFWASPGFQLPTRSAGDIDRLAGRAAHKEQAGRAGVGFLEQELGGLVADAILINVDLDGAGVFDDVVEGQDDGARIIRLAHHAAEGGGAVGIDDDGVEALVDEVVHRGDLGGKILADGDDLELGQILGDLGLGRIGLGGPDHLHAPVIGDEAVDEGDAVRACLAGIFEELGVGAVGREALRIGRGAGNHFGGSLGRNGEGQNGRCGGAESEPG
jgi:hypothetical protein